MKIQIRRAVYETNSSSTHSITMMMKSDYEKWEREGLYLYNGYAYGYEFSKPEVGKLYTKDEAMKLISLSKYYSDSDYNSYSDDEELLIEYGFYPYDYEDDYLESYFKEFNTPSGDTVVAFGQYGHD